MRQVYDQSSIDKYLFAISENDVNALKDLYKATKNVLFAYALSIVNNRQDAEDVLHDTYIQVYAKAKNYTSANKPLAWLMTIVKNLCLQKLRTNKQNINLDYVTWEKEFAFDNRIAEEEKRLLYECLNTLNQEERQIVIMHALTGYKHKEIAQIFDLPVSTVLSKYNRAIKKLNEYVEKEELK